MLQRVDAEFGVYPNFTSEKAKEEIVSRSKINEFSAIELKSIHKVIRNIYLGKRDFNTRELGYVLNENYQNKGYGSEASKAMVDTIQSGGIALGAFCNDRLIGFCSVNKDLFGKKYKYVLLDQLFISKEYRNMGIGKNLFKMVAIESHNLGAEKYYICAGSAEETIAFYFAIGCEVAKEINQELYQNDTRDYQLEFGLRRSFMATRN